MTARGVKPTVGLIVAWTLLVPGSAQVVIAGGLTRIAGTLNGEPVTVGEVDEIVGHRASQLWQEEEGVLRSAARAICTDRALARLSAREGFDLLSWRTMIWQAVAVSEEDARRYVAKHPETFGDGQPDIALVRHRLRVQRYRDRVRMEAEREIGGTFALDPRQEALPSLAALRPTTRIAECLGGTITRAEVEQYASFPLYRRRAEAVALLCRQFEIDYSNRLMLERVAQKRGISVADLLREAEGEVPEIGRERVESEAEAHYGKADAVSLFKARLALDAKARADRRMAFIDQIRRETTGHCTLEFPDPPVVSVRGRMRHDDPDHALEVTYFGNLRCRHCDQSWDTLHVLRRAYSETVRFVMRHHFPDTVYPLFREAVEMECAAQQKKLWAYGDWKIGHPAPGSSAGGPVMDDAAMARCEADPRTAVKVLDDTEEALRLGFRDAVPSWVIGRRPRRGFQGAEVLVRTIEEEQAALAGLTANGQSHDERPSGR